MMVAQYARYDESTRSEWESQESLTNPFFSFNSSIRFPSCQHPFNMSLSALQIEFGDKIGRFFFDYALLHRQIMCNDNGTMKQSDRKVLIIQPSSGTANRAQSLVSGFLLAALTKRAIWIDWQRTAAFNCPFEQIWKIPTIDSLMDSMKYGHWNSWIATRLAALGRETDPIAQFRLHSLNADFWLCGDYQENIAIDTHTGESLTFVHIATDESLLPVITKNPTYTRQIQEWFGEGVDPFVSIFKFMMRPLQNITERVEKFQKQHFPNGCDIGMQIRHWGVSWIRFGELDEFWKCAAPDLQEASKIYKRNPTVYLTSDDTGTIKTAARFLSDAAGGLNVSVANLNGFVEDQFYQMCADLESALVEIYLLSSCRTVIGTSWSSYSMLAMVLAREPRRSKMVTHVETDPTSGKSIGTGRERECLPDEYPHCKIINRNGCVQQTFTHLCYMEARHLPVHSCFQPSMFEQDSCCQHGYCGPIAMCIHHTGYAWYSDLIFMWRVWHPARSIIFIPAGLFAMSVWIGVLTLPCRICFCGRCGIPRRVYLSISFVLASICVGIAQHILVRVAQDLIS